ncbi:transglycosylase family protein [Streptomyces sp. B1866]|uniref:transglycosylase family protein n=1 Tax=Streptomyces sp. B1866 TaxID=3075431 RepID=UPI00288E7739|nr:transglycosylase family protein [Streptomyces sp. B1866]MDT3398338.1 transglycosylase family protein [Streptomyces sp. B1866]
MNTSKGKHRRPSRATRIAALVGVAGAAVGVPLAAAGTASAATVSQWDQVAQCESGGDWSINTGNGYYGGLQFSSHTWSAYGGTSYAPTADQATKAQQIAIGQRVLAAQGRGAWPTCGVGLTAGGGTTVDGPAQRTVRKKTARADRPAVTSAKRHGGGHARPKRTAPHRLARGDGEYTVREGDTLATIAEKHGVEGGWQKLYERNRDIVSDADLIYPGQRLHLR